jgi:hypothetical protein
MSLLTRHPDLFAQLAQLLALGGRQTVASAVVDLGLRQPTSYNALGQVQTTVDLRGPISQNCGPARPSRI